MKLFWIFFIALYISALFIKIYQHNYYIHHLFKKQTLEYELIALRNEKNKKQSDLFRDESGGTDFENNYERLNVRDIRVCENKGRE